MNISIRSVEEALDLGRAGNDDILATAVAVSCSSKGFVIMKGG